MTRVPARSAHALLRFAGLLAACLALAAGPLAADVLTAAGATVCADEDACEESCPDGPDGDHCPPGCGACACAVSLSAAVLPAAPGALALVVLGTVRSEPPLPAGAGARRGVFRPPR